MAVNTTKVEHSWHPGAAMAAEALADIAFTRADEIVVETELAGAPGVRAPLVAGVDYEVVVPAGASWGTVRALAAWAAGDWFHARRQTARTQDEAFSPFELKAASVGAAADKAARISQEQDAEIARSLQVPRGQVPPALDTRLLGDGELLRYDAAAGAFRRFGHESFAGKFFFGGPNGLLVPVAGVPSSDISLEDLTDPTGGALIGLASGRSVADKLGEMVSVFDFLTLAERAAVTARTRALDVTAAIQAAIDSNPGRLFFPPGDYPVTPGETTALLVDGTAMELFGKGVTIAMASDLQRSALRIVNAPGVTLRDLRFEGSGTDGAGGGQGLVQVFQGSDFTATGCDFDDANCDGLAVAQVDGVAIVNCRSRNASKAGLYVNNSSNVRIDGNMVDDFGGHIVDGAIVGIGIQLSGNQSVSCERNVIAGGVGIGILCDSGLGAPKANLIAANVVAECANPTNSGVSGGIRLGNLLGDKACGTVLANNLVTRCGLYNFYVENHDGTVLQGNVGSESQRSNYVVATATGTTLLANTAIATGTENLPGSYAYHLINDADASAGDGNRALTMASYATTYGSDTIRDDSTGSNRLFMLQDYLEFSFTWEPNAGAAIASGASVYQTFDGAAGAVLGMTVDVAAPYTVNGCSVSGYVNESGELGVVLSNLTGADRTFAEGEWRFRVYGAGA